MILHADLDAFFASVEQRDDPALRHRPVAVGGGVVVAASYAAKAAGVRAGMGGRAARRLCPDLVIVPPRFAAYSAASDAVFDVFRDVTPRVEAMSIDEAFLDVSGLQRLAGPPAVIGRRLRAEVAERVGLPITVGIARTKVLAKVASRVAKPDGLLEVPVDAEQAFLHPLPVEVIWGVGRSSAATLHAHGIRTVAELAALDERSLVAMLGRSAGGRLHALAHCREPVAAARAVRPGRRRRSIGAQRALGRGPWAPGDLDAPLRGLVDRVAGRLRRAQLTARTVVLRLRLADYRRVTRSHTLAASTDDTARLLQAAQGLLAGAAPLVAQHGVTLVGVALTGLDDDDTAQLELPFGRVGGTVVESAALDAALDGVRARWGSAAVSRGLTVPPRRAAPGTPPPPLPGRRPA